MLNDESWISVIFFGVAIFFFFLSKKYFDNLIHKEKIIVTRDALTIIITTSKEVRHVFPIDTIKSFGYANIIEYTKHPMNNDIVDFTGLATTEKELHYLIDDGNIEIESDGQTLRFGKNIASWDIDNIINQIETFLQIKFQNKHESIEISEKDWSSGNLD